MNAQEVTAFWQNDKSHVSLKNIQKIHLPCQADTQRLCWTFKGNVQ